MANIAISDLHTVGANLFQDSESFLNDITNEEMTNLSGGFFISFHIATVDIGILISL
ncbi:hypothetical protein H6G97_28795 [Nostoc flagelliforme FACHB-838]|uniref:Uncharacterized protein n=1 Tax=Nostoc flagelliforme FACHB-838 TaxID=2692904 RepID=A0ABR8DVF0_9NOSO|nr:hypothetical protein [Nostoc flagelliforme]MBD2533346.1 hypothetical protein [Nostoc flagelliforme FACHB-838]